MLFSISFIHLFTLSLKNDYFYKKTIILFFVKIKQNIDEGF